MFKYLHFFTLALNDKLREHSILHIMESLGENKKEWEDKKKQQKLEIIGADYT